MVDPNVRFISAVIMFVLSGGLLAFFSYKAGKYITTPGLTNDKETIAFFGCGVLVIFWVIWAALLASIF